MRALKTNRVNVMNKAEKHALAQKVIQETKSWVENVIVKNNICPFAETPFKQNTIHYKVSHATVIDDVIDSLVDALIDFDESDPDETETALLVLPRALADFDDYNQFLDVVDSALEELELVDVIRVDSFHPEYCFAGLEQDDVQNYTNRSIYPMFLFKREESLEHARANYPNAKEISENNMKTLQEMGLEAVLEQRKRCLAK